MYDKCLLYFFRTINRIRFLRIYDANESCLQYFFFPNLIVTLNYLYFRGVPLWNVFLRDGRSEINTDDDGRVFGPGFASFMTRVSRRTIPAIYRYCGLYTQQLRRHNTVFVTAWESFTVFVFFFPHFSFPPVVFSTSVEYNDRRRNTNGRVPAGSELFCRPRFRRVRTRSVSKRRSPLSVGHSRFLHFSVPYDVRAGHEEITDLPSFGCTNTESVDCKHKYNYL